MSTLRFFALMFVLTVICASPIMEHRASAQTYVEEPGAYVEGGEPYAVDTTTVRSSRERASWMLAYPMALAIGDFHNYVSDVSFRGFSFSAEWPVGGGGLRIGGALDYNLFYDERPQNTYQRNAGAVTATLYNYADVWSAGLLGRYRFLDTNAKVRPYLGLELGATYLNAKTLIADFDLSDDQWGFMSTAELGALTHVGTFTDVTFALRYSVTSASFGAQDWPMFLALQLGISLGG